MVVAFVVMLSGASGGTRTHADRPADVPDYQRERPANRCQITGQHVSGVVSVELGDGRHAQLTLVDVRATVAMAPVLGNVLFYVEAPLRFSGRFVSRDLGGPGAYTARAYRSPDGHVRLAAREPFEITLASDPSMASVRLPSPFGDGAIVLTVPCSELSAGTPRVTMRPRPVEARPRLITLRPGTRVLSETGGHGAEVARVEGRPDAPAPIQFVGTVGAAQEGFARVSLRVGPARIEGFVPATSVESLGVGGGPAAPIGDYGVVVDMLQGTTLVRLPVGTALFATASGTERPWGMLTVPMSVLVRSAAPGERAEIQLDTAQVGNHPCRFDGVPGRVFCGDPRNLPPLSLTSCEGSRCTPVAFVMRP